jgi:hypothetical protein
MMCDDVLDGALFVSAKLFREDSSRERQKSIYCFTQDNDNERSGSWRTYSTFKVFVIIESLLPRLKPVSLESVLEICDEVQDKYK